MFSLAFGVMAQNDNLVVTITEIDDQNFPEVTVSVAVWNQGGVVDDLTRDEVSQFEDGVAFDPTRITTVEPTNIEDLRLVLALDLSIPNTADFAATKAGAAALIDAIGPRDKVALLTFDNDVDLAYGDFTNNTTELRAIIDDLTPQGDKTALHKALAEATTVTDKLTGEHKAIIVITDSRDNAASLAAAQALERVQQGNVPLFIIGFSDKIRPEVLKAGVAATGGEFFVLSRSAQIQTTLEEIEIRLRQGYNITFQSTLKADDDHHELSIVVDHQTGIGQTTGQFQAISREMPIALPDLPPGQPLVGTVVLTPSD